MNDKHMIIRAVIALILQGQDHRDLVVNAIDRLFIQQALRLFEQVVYAKLRGDSISTDWYRAAFIEQERNPMDIAWNAGINVKTVTNKRRTATREIVIEESMAHYAQLRQLIDSLANDELDLELTLTLQGVSVRLNLTETVVVVNALAVRRAGLRGGTWSSIGKNVEGPLMETICRAFRAPERHFTRAIESDGSLREVDFNLFTPAGERVKCEVKLMGKGNPESADAVVARGSQVFVASALSDLNKRQLDERGVHWTELQREHGFLRFAQTLRAYGIPFEDIAPGEVDQQINEALEATFGVG